MIEWMLFDYWKKRDIVTSMNEPEQYLLQRMNSPTTIIAIIMYAYSLPSPHNIFPMLKRLFMKGCVFHVTN